MTGRRYGVAITWDPVDFAKPVDLDLQAIIIDKRGYIDAQIRTENSWKQKPFKSLPRMISTSSVNENSAAAAFAVNLPVSQPGNMDLFAAASGPRSMRSTTTI